MAEVKWIKITTNIFDDDKIRLIETLPEGDSILVIWLKLLTLAGKQNFQGFLMMNERIAYTDEMLHTIFNRPLPLVRLALQSFEQFGMIEVIDNRYYITNWEKHQNVDGLDKIREQTRRRVANHRERAKVGNVTGNVTVTLGNATEEEREEDKNKKEDKERDRESEGEKEPLMSVSMADVLSAFQKAFRGLMPTPFQLEDLQKFHTEDGMSIAIMIEAIKRTSNNNANYNYLQGILRNWAQKGIQTMEQVQADDANFEQRRQGGRSAIAQPSKSNVPDWHNDDYKNETTPEELAELERKKQELLGKIRKKDD